MNQVIYSYSRDLEDALKILSSEENQKKLILNIDNDTNEMLPPEELLEYLFDRYEYATKHGYIKGDFLKYMDILRKMMYRLVNGNYKSEKQLLNNPKWKEAMSLAKDILTLPEAKIFFAQPLSLTPSNHFSK